MSDQNLIGGAALLVTFLFGYWRGRRRQRLLNREPGGYSPPPPEHVGEGMVRRALMAAFPGPTCYLFNNLTLPHRDGTTQIDHILMSPYGIFVIETKHYSGTIYADTAATVWQQRFRVRTQEFQNPLHQNFAHTSAIHNLLASAPPDHIHSLVVFTGTATFPQGYPKDVVNLAGLVPYIRQYTEPVLAPTQIELYVGRLETARYRISRQTDVEHQAYLRRRFGDEN